MRMDDNIHTHFMHQITRSRHNVAKFFSWVLPWQTMILVAYWSDFSSQCYVPRCWKDWTEKLSSQDGRTLSFRTSPLVNILYKCAPYLCDKMVVTFSMPCGQAVDGKSNSLWMHHLLTLFPRFQKATLGRWQLILLLHLKKIKARRQNVLANTNRTESFEVSHYSPNLDTFANLAGNIDPLVWPGSCQSCQTCTLAITLKGKTLPNRSISKSHRIRYQKQEDLQFIGSQFWVLTRWNMIVSALILATSLTTIMDASWKAWSYRLSSVTFWQEDNLFMRTDI